VRDFILAHHVAAQNTPAPTKKLTPTKTRRAPRKAT
jgi:hypothetical protein